MKTVDPDCVYGVKVSQWLPLIANERHVAPDLFDRAAGLNPSDHVAPRQMLVFETHVGLGENADLGQTADRSTGQAEPTTKRNLWFCWHE
ncbi:MAG TPA: hypothetical protein VKO18_07390 [Terriglobia bacterium]|nr:hypothetical protein [Terriglobia bacterium]